MRERSPGLVVTPSRDRCHTRGAGALDPVVDRETELTLVGRLRQGEADAFDEVYAAFNKPLFTFLIRLSRRRDVAEDLHEETWLRLVKHAGRCGPTRGWGPGSSRSHATCTSATGVRGRWRTRRRQASWGCGPFSARETSPFEETAANELERRIERALATLPAASREVLLLVGVAGLDHSEVADICGITPAALRQRLHRARELLAHALERDAAGPVLVEGVPSCPTR